MQKEKSPTSCALNVNNLSSSKNTFLTSKQKAQAEQRILD